MIMWGGGGGGATGLVNDTWIYTPQPDDVSLPTPLMKRFLPENSTRGVAGALLLALCGVAPGADPASLTADRAAIEHIYYDHRTGTKPPFEQVMPQTLLEKLVRDDLKKEAVLDRVYGVKVTPAMVEAEMRRINATTRAPEVLAEIKTVLGNDPARFANTMARPILVGRTLRARFDMDPQLHAPQRHLVEAARARLLALKEGDFAARLAALKQTQGKDVEVLDAVTWQLTPRPPENAPALPVTPPGPTQVKATGGLYTVEATAQVAQVLSSPAPTDETRHPKFYFEDLPVDLQNVLRAQLQKPASVSAVIEAPAVFQLYPRQKPRPATIDRSGAHHPQAQLRRVARRATRFQYTMKTRSLIALFFLLSATFAQGGTRTSANYSITTDTADSGGAPSTSANYSNNGSAGSVAGISTVAMPAEITKAGYIGQLYNAVGLVVAAPASNVDEGLDFPLSAAETLDDGTSLAVNPGSVSWSVLTGPVSNVSIAGVATAGTVSQNTAASVQGSYSGFNNTVNLTVIPLAISTGSSQQTAIVGQPFSFTISPASGEGPFTYQWMQNGSNISGATGSTYSIASASAGNAGNYTVQVTNSFGSYITAAFDLTVGNGIPAMTTSALVTLALLLFFVGAKFLPAKPSKK